MGIDIESLTLRQIREIAKLANGTCAPKGAATKYPDEPAVIVRAYSGVFFGYMLSRKTGTVELRDARQIYYWDSAGMDEKVMTCPDIATLGLGTGSKVSKPAERAIVEQVGAVFHATEVAIKAISAQKWATR